MSAVLAASSGCATTANRKHQEDLDSVKKALGALATRVDAMEGRLAAPKAAPQAQAPAPPLKTVGVTPHPAEGAGTDVPPLPAVTDPEPGFVNDGAVQEYRRAMVFFEAGRYGEAISGFSTFLEKFPDHPFAGSAQFYVGESHLNQKEYPQAYEEFSRVLTTYDRSSHVAATLR
ncbi:MAG TPA: tetratricopeptide repeat protein, partial [Bdellovibrionota bacterium]|nr:tetratricopeptide repeat protein [Bdellovibrionota bacterium]